MVRRAESMAGDMIGDVRGTTYIGGGSGPSYTASIYGVLRESCASSFMKKTMTKVAQVPRQWQRALLPVASEGYIHTHKTLSPRRKD